MKNKTHLAFYYKPLANRRTLAAIRRGIRVEKIEARDVIEALDKAKPMRGETVLNTVLY